MTDPFAVLAAHERYGLPLAFSSDGDTLYTGGFDGSASAWSVSEEAELTSRRVHEQSINCGVRDGERLLTGSTDCTIRRFTLSLEATGAVLEGHSRTVADIALHPDDPLLASASYDSTVRIWNLSEDSALKTLEGHLKNVTCVEFLSGGTHVASGGLGEDLFVWDPESGAVETTLGGHGDAVAGLTVETDDRFWTVSYDGTVYGWRTADWSETISIDLAIDGKATGLAARPQSDQLAITVDGGVHLITTAGETVATHETSIQGISAPRWSADGRMLAVGGADGAIRLYR